MAELYNLEVEKTFLACILQYQDSLAEVSIITDRDFSPLNSTIFKIIKNEIDSGKTLSTVLLADKIKSYNIQMEGVEAYDYLEALKLLPVNEKEIESLAKQLKKLSVLREYEEIGKEIVKRARNSQSEEFIDIVNGMDKIFNGKVNQFGGSEEEPEDLFSNVMERIEEAGNSPHETGLYAKNFPLFTKYFGSYLPGDCYFFAARSKAGKSSLLLSQCFDIVNNPDNGNVRVLYLDTEIETYRAQRRIISAITGVSTYYLRTGFFRKNPEMERKVREAWKVLPSYFNKIDHIYVGGKSFEEIVSITKRWFHKNISRYSNKKALICFDYLKLGQEMPSNAVKDYVIIGKKVDALKQLATDLQVPVITACQTNRSNEGKKSADSIVEDGSAVGLSDQINMYASAVFGFRKLTQEEQIEFGFDINSPNTPTHSLVPFYTRELGEDTHGMGLVKYMGEKGKIKYRENFIFLRFENFSAREIIDFRGWVKANGRDLATEAQIQQEEKERLL